MVKYTECPNCNRITVVMENGEMRKNQHGQFSSLANVTQSFLVRPRGSSRPAVPPQVPKDIAEDYSEACLVIADSPKASAALSRRCLQHLLREAAGVKHSNLFSEIQEVIDSSALPSYITEGLDAVRVSGNFAAHPIKSTQTGEILPVEPGEAEWNLDILETLFDFYYVQPDIVAKKKAALNAKLQSSGKPPLR